MKKLIAILLTITFILSMTACEKADVDETRNPISESQQQSSNETETTEAQTHLGTDKVTVEMVDSHPTNAESDFMISLLDDTCAMIIEYVGTDEIVTIPEEIKGYKITAIKNYVFANDTSVKGVKLADSIEYIEECAFGLNKNLQVFIGGKNLKKIGLGAFQYCENMTEFVIRSELEELGNISVAGCTSLTEVELPCSLKIIDDAFLVCSENLVLIGEAGSVVEQYAENAGINFQSK